MCQFESIVRMVKNVAEICLLLLVTPVRGVPVSASVIAGRGPVGVGTNRSAAILVLSAVSFLSSLPLPSLHVRCW